MDESPLHRLGPPRSRTEIVLHWLRLRTEILTVFGCLSLLILLFGPVFWRVGRGGPRPCSSNLKQVILGTLMYAQDFDDRFPPRLRWIDSVMPYIKNESVFRCPELLESDRNAYGYAFNGILSSVPLKNVTSPESTPVIYDSDQLGRGAFDHVSSFPTPGRHKGGNYIGFVDGHVKWIADNKKHVLFTGPRL